MKLVCPRCDATVKIGEQSRFDNFRCGACQHLFVGLEAEIGIIDFLLGFFFGFETPCPHCRAGITLQPDSRRGGYSGPRACYRCRSKLPTSHRIERQIEDSTPAPPAIPVLVPSIIDAIEPGLPSSHKSSPGLDPQERIQQLEEALCECEQELDAASSIIEEQDLQIEELKLQLEGADMMLEDAAEARRKLEQRLAEATDEDACQMAVPKGNLPTPPTLDDGPKHGYPPGYKPNPVVEAIIAQFEAREKK